ncbi:TrbC/VirB2 family protein [Actinopolymorpha alba]|uniref:TrbC/VirB2 family protein n=1 Tax=Actinopolymorpha alba TaxID=533267 RepID=UPI00038024D4|nr:TrbC/VirB2 family protein [Actinopolymorpha alba]
MGDLVIVASGGSQLDAFFGRIQSLLAGVAVGALTVAIIIIGFKVMFAIRRGDNFREAIQNMGVVAFAALLIGGASGIAALLSAIGKQVGGQ